jgi:hypothetical protein
MTRTEIKLTSRLIQTYAKLEKDQYQKITTWTRAGTMTGRTFGYVVSQMIILTKLGTYRTLNVIALILPCCALFFSILMPRVHWKSMVKRMAEARGINSLDLYNAIAIQQSKLCNQRSLKKSSKFPKHTVLIWQNECGHSIRTS